MKLTQTLKQKPTVSPQLVLANELLVCSSLELEQAIAQELAQNPALELQDVQRCPTCGAQLTGGTCPTCRVDGGERDRQGPADSENWRDGDFDAVAAAPGEWDDPLSRVASRTTLPEYVLQQARLSLPEGDLGIARHLLGSLDERGLLSCDVGDLAGDLGVDRERVEAVLRVVQSLEPTGIAARDARECLLVQLKELPEGRTERTVAEHLIRNHWDALGRSSLQSLGQEVDVSAEEVRNALCFIRKNLNPFPAHAGWTQSARAPAEDQVVCAEPDVIIRRREGLNSGYVIELPKAGRHRLRVRAVSERAWERVQDDDAESDGSGWDRWQQLCGRARLFVRSIEQRWETLHRLMRCLMDYQRGFLDGGERYLKPLTRTQVAEWMDVHESTISRAVAGKYVELPCRRVVPLEIFFDSAAPVKHLIRQLVEHEDESLSDSAIAERLGEYGYDVARRTVAKYRNALDILPSSLRRRERELRTLR